MKCRKAQDLFFKSRDGALDEVEGLALTRHLARCPSCALFVKEMEASLETIAGLPEPQVSEGFEWNVKRRILREKSQLMRREGALPFGEKWWMSRFAVGAAAAAAIVVVASIFAVERLGAPRTVVEEAAPLSSRGSAPALPVSSVDDGSFGGYTAGPRMVSDNIYTFERGGETARQSPFDIVASSREDALTRENEMLKRRIDNLERQIVWLKGLLDKERMQRLDMSLP